MEYQQDICGGSGVVDCAIQPRSVKYVLLSMLSIKEPTVTAVSFET